ncbi:MAG: sigma-70 family RNA polymerase sigma factor [Paraclostridium sp.]
MNKLVNLVMTYQNGDKDAFIEIINIFRPALNKFKRNSYCEDIDSELILFLITLLEKLEMRERFLEDDKYIFSYIFKSLRNKYIRINKKNYSTYSFELLNDEFSNFNISEYLETNVEFFDLIKGLSSCERNILDRYYINNLTESDIAKELNTSRQYINKTHKKALNKLKNTLECYN